LAHKNLGTLNLSPPGANLANTFLTQPLIFDAAPSFGLMIS
jgi:hypothetical protein